MDATSSGLLVAVVTVILCLLFYLLTHYSARRIVPNRYEWMHVLNHTEWVFGSDVVDRMLELKKSKQKWLLLMIVYSDLDSLESEGLLEERVFDSSDGDDLPRTGHRLTSGGVRKKVERLNLSSQK